MTAAALHLARWYCVHNIQDLAVGVVAPLYQADWLFVWPVVEYCILADHKNHGLMANFVPSSWRRQTHVLLLQEHARDSFENLLFGLCRFYELTGHYPSKITMVSYTLKQKRFEDLHRAAVHYPKEQFSFVGTPVPPAATGATAVRHN